MQEIKTQNSGVNRLYNYFAKCLGNLTREVEKERKSLLTFAFAAGIIGTILSLFGFLLNPLFLVFGLLFLIISPLMAIRDYYCLEAKRKVLPVLFKFWGNFQFIARKDSLPLHIYRSFKNKVPIVEAF